MFGDTEFDSYNDGGFHPSPVYLEDEEYLDSYGEDMDAESAESMKDEGVYYERISLSELMDQCIIPTLSQAIQTIYPLMVLCLICRVTCVFCFKASGGEGSGRILANSTSFVLGVVGLHLFYQENMIFVIMLAVLVYPLMVLTYCKCHSWTGISVSVVVLVYLLTCELLVVKEAEWHQIRGAQMMLAMKLISLAFDLDSGVVRELPGMWNYAGYALHVGSVIFGPWIGYQDYATLLHSPEERLFDFFWVWKLCASFFSAVSCVLVSTCVAHWLLLDTSFLWLLAFRDALSFRFSHYFVCRLSEVTLTLSGLGAVKSNGDIRWDFTTTRLFHIELPRSLVEVVTNWNLPMHYWLKTYVFKTAKPLGNFAAILITYAASSILHGINFQLSAVLLSLGFYSYIEHVLRKRLSEAFSACIEARRCRADCKHLNKAMHLYVILTNIGFGLLSVFHLTYLGLMFDNSSEEEQGYSMDHTLNKWSHLGFASHWVAAATYVFYLLI